MKVTDTLRILSPASTYLLPDAAHPGDAGYDLRAAADVKLHYGMWALVPTGLRMSIPAGTVGMVCPRSGLAAKHGVTVLNAPGIIDEGYRGEVRVALINHSRATYSVERGERIAQLVLVPFIAPAIEIVDSLDETSRGDGGFGSTGR